MLPFIIVAPLVGVAGATLLWLFDKEAKHPKVQTLTHTTAGGIPVKTVIPVDPRPTLAQVTMTPPPVTAPPPAGPPPGPSGSGPTYAPAAVVVPSPSGSPVLQLAPMVITPTGAASMSITTVSDIQNALNTLNIPNPLLTVDGTVGPLTQTAIRAFQAKAGMPTDGSPGPATRKALSDAIAKLASDTNAHIGASPQVAQATASAPPPVVSAPTNTVNPGTTAMTIDTPTTVQHALNVLGAKPALVEDGKIGPMSIAAIRAFQLTHGLTVDGIAGPKTKAALALCVTAQLGSSSNVSGEMVSGMMTDELLGTKIHGMC